MRLVALAPLAGLLFAPLACRADLTGDTLHVVFDNPPSGMAVEDDGYLVVPGTTMSIGELTVIVGGSNITVLDSGQQSFPTGSFSGLVFTDISGDPMISGVMEDPTLSTLNGIDPSFTSNSVSLNFAGVTMAAGQDAAFDLSFASPTPEPSSFALLGTGLLGIAGVVRRRFVPPAA